MAKVLVSESHLLHIANAIRTKNGTQNSYTPAEMAEAISNIESGYPEPSGTVNITQNGTTNVKDYASANVNVPNSYSTGDEGKVVSNGALVAQGSQTITQNGTYDTTLKNEVIVNIEGGGGSSVDTEIPVNEYAFNFTPSNNANSAVSAGFAFTTSKRIKVSKIRVWARETTASAYISKGETNIASVVDATVVADQWNDLTLNEPIILEPWITYIIWYSMPNYACKYKNSTITSDKSYITYIGGRWSSSRKTIPTNSESTAYGVDFYIDSYIEEQSATISTDFSAEKTIPTMTSNTAPSGVASASSFINSNFDAFHAFDGINTNAQMQNGWLATASDNAPYIQYLFDAKHKFSLLILALGNNGPTVSRNVTIQGRKSDGTWENCLATGSEVQLEFTSGKYGANCKKYNITLNGNEYDGLRIIGNASFYGGANQYACVFDEIQVYEMNELTGIGYYGIEVPDSSFGENGNIYVNIMTKEIYQKNNGAWAQISM